MMVPLESEVQSLTIELLTLHKYTVLVNTVKLRGRRAGMHNTGQSKGIPDLSVTKDYWPVGVWVGLEMKRPGGKMRPEQEALFNRGRILVSDDCEDALRQLKPIDEMFKQWSG